MPTNRELRAQGLPHQRPIREIVIRLFADGSCQTSAPMAEKQVCEEMLNAAAKAIANYHAQSEAEEKGGEASRIIQFGHPNRGGNLILRA